MNPTKAARVAFPADRLPRLIAASIIVVGAAVSLVLNFPGHLEYDSIVQLSEGRTGDYGGLHPPVMSWLLGMADALRPGASLFVVFDTLLVDGALLSFVLLRRTTSWVAAPLAGGFVAIPQLLIYPAIVWKDVLFAGAATAGFACLAYAGAFWGKLVWRYGLLTAALLLLTLGALARQNGAVVLPFAAVAVGWISARSGGAGDLRHDLAHGLAFLAGAAVIAAGASAALETRVEDQSSIGQQWEELQFWDIVSAVSLEPHVDLGPLRDRAPWIEAIVRTRGVATYSPTQWDSVEPILDRIEARKSSADIIGAQWRELIAREPLLYLRVRARAFEWVFLTPEPQNCALVFTGVDKDPQDERESLGIVRRYTQVDRALEAYADRFASTPIYSHAAFGAVGLALLVVLLRRRQPPDLAVAAMLASALAFAASFAVISIGCDYRYVYYLDLAVIAAALYATGTSRRETRNRQDVSAPGSTRHHRTRRGPLQPLPPSTNANAPLLARPFGLRRRMLDRFEAKLDGAFGLLDRERLLARLRAVLPGERLIATTEAMRPYESDGLAAYRSLPAAVALPVDAGEAAAVLQICRELRVPVVARGAGTGLSGGALPFPGSVLLALGKLNRILAIDPVARTARVQPGVRNLAISEAVKPYGLFYAPDPSSQLACSIGGNVAENAGGVHCLKYGLTVHNILKLEALTIDSERLTIGSDALDAPGFDLMALLTGSEGLLAVVTEITVRLLPLPADIQALLVAFPDAGCAAQAVADIIAAGITPAGLEMMDELALTAAEQFAHAGYPLDAGAILICECDGAVGDAEAELQHVAEICRAAGASEVRHAKDEADRARLWAGRKGAFPAMGRIAPDYYCIDGTIPRRELPQVLARIAELSSEFRLAVANVFHAGDGNLHPLILYDAAAPGELDRAEALGGAILELCVAVGGTITGEHGVGREKINQMCVQFSTAELEAFAAIKAAFDPPGLLNPGKAVPTLARCAEFGAMHVHRGEVAHPELPRF